MDRTEMVRADPELEQLPGRWRMDITAMDRTVKRYNLYINVYATGI